MSGNAKRILVSASELAYILDVKLPTVSQWLKLESEPLHYVSRKGRAYMIDPKIALQWWLRRQQNQEMAGNRGGGADADTSKVVNFHEQKTRLTKAQADEKELKLQQARGELVPLEDVSGVVSGACQILSSALSSIPAELQRVAPHLTASDIDAVRRVLARVQNSLASIEVTPADIGLPADPESVSGD